MQKTTFFIQKMDCSSEEQLIRLKLEGFENIAALEFDVSHRRLTVHHTGEHEPIFKEINALELDARVEASGVSQEYSGGHGRDVRLLTQVLLINFLFFLLEILTGFLSNSMGLLADGLDMLADSLVYGLALFAVGGTMARKKTIARVGGYFQLALAVFGMLEVLHRFFSSKGMPVFQTMMMISLLALLGNAGSLYLLQKSKNTESHIQASMIFTSNDVIANLGVIFAGGLVFITHSKFPDLLIGGVVFVLVARGAYRILQLAK